MRSLIVLVSLVVCFGLDSSGAEFSLGAYGGADMLTGGSVLDFKIGATYGASIKYHLDRSWRLTLDASRVTLSNTTGGDSTSAIGSLKSNAAVDFTAWRVAGSLQRLLLSPQSRFNIALGAGGGMTLWKIIDPAGDTTFQTVDEHQGKLAFKASELFVGASAGFLFALSSRAFIESRLRADYFTGAGANFASEIDAARDRWLIGGTLSINLRFGRSQHADDWRLPQANQENQRTSDIRRAQRAVGDADGDGVRDEDDTCLATPRGVIVDNHGCPVDNDRDGVPDGLDDCPGTSSEARGRVDIHGCPVDSDFDGVPDFRDQCPGNLIGAVIDSTGCPVDSDKDGVPDGLDDCPNTLFGVKVDRYGCVDLAIFAKPMILHIDYMSGSFEVDAKAKSELQKLAALLSVVPDIRLEISAYTDDIGTDAANLRLSEKRANRVRDYLVAYGVPDERMKPFGRGETNPLASNSTAEGRARNRRIEIQFFK
ncbi:MAG: OmpA family protein [Candidatus Zixiibacteriota bacterium]